LYVKNEIRFLGHTILTDRSTMPFGNIVGPLLFGIVCPSESYPTGSL